MLGLGGPCRAKPPALHKPHSSPSSAIRPHRLPLSPRLGKVASDLRRGQPERGHWDGGRACLLAMRVSRSVLLSVCEAVIRFQDFSQCDRPATRLCTPPSPPHPLQQRDPTTTRTSAPLHLNGHLQPHPRAKRQQTFSRFRCERGIKVSK